MTCTLNDPLADTYVVKSTLVGRLDAVMDTKDVGGIIENLFAEAWSSADHRHCFIEGHARDLDKEERYWDGV